ncbi:DUF1287 domain-containing protein [Bifidobacterium pullorum subsp. saeculare]|uniref:DUF1287 domain-containing protein n=1 Tax=Bifidobacterium pullorum subsp. saeculare TaxID=78257 RepID=A0A938WYU0_9BIFI|nr:DUF1287 domain-containing protein [Bifidobacterium pullorum]MBM6700147.1 DUF1287 domain-containing protein [Bifidobacterium pullorum subsp. saeculare]
MAARTGRRRRRTVIALAAGLAILVVAFSAAVLTLRHAGELSGGISPAAIARAIRNAADKAGAQDASTMPADQAAKDYPFQPSLVDYDGDGIDDYTDILHGAQADSRARPAYDDGYYQGGYPPADRGACTDVMWRAFRDAGYDLKAMVDADVAADPGSYAAVAPRPDPNIDFRRTGVLDVFLRKYALTLTTDIADHGAWQAGDIVVFEHTRHIGVISDRRDKDGIPFVDHNMGQQQRENDYLAFRHHMAVTGHYRWDASRVPASVLRRWQG